MGREARVNQDILIINQRLADFFGKDVVTGQAIHRIIHARNVTEKRHHKHADVFTEGGIFLREEFNVTKEVLKYPFLQDCYVLEMLIPYEKLDGEEKEEIGLDDNKYSYECFYAFKDKHGKPLPVNWKAVEVIMHFKLYGKVEKSSEKMDDSKIAEQDAKHIAYFEDVMKQDSLITDPKAGVKGLFVPSNYDKQRYGSGRLQDESAVKTNQQLKTITLSEMQGA